MFKKGFLNSLANRFKADTCGNVAIIFALATVPLLIAAGSAVDIARAHIVQTRLQAALDAGALAAASSPGLTDEERIKAGKTVFNANYPEEKLGTPATPIFDIEDGKVVASVDANLPTTIMNVAGIEKLDVSTSTEITIPSLKDGEVVLVLDYSGSMNSKGKYQTMRDSAIKLIETLTEEGENEEVKFGLVPFSHHVYTTLPKDYVANQTGSGSWTGCTYDRLYPLNTKSTTPNVEDDDTKWGIEVDDPHNDWGCNGYISRGLEVRPLTDDHFGTIAQLNDMSPYAWTNIALGMEFGWHLLTPNAPYTQATSDNDEVVKAIVLLTDGRQTQKSWGPNGSRTVANGEENLETMCTSIKNEGILVITVAFDLQDEDTEDRLRDCATNPDEFFYIAETNAQLVSSFDAITKQLAKAVYISK